MSILKKLHKCTPLLNRESGLINIRDPTTRGKERRGQFGLIGMMLRQAGQVINNFNSANSVHCLDVAQVPSVTNLAMMLIMIMMTYAGNIDYDDHSNEDYLTGSIGDPWVAIPGLK